MAGTGRARSNLLQSGIAWRGTFRGKRRMDQKLYENGQIATRYVDADGNVQLNDEEWNVNGSYYAIEGITSPDGRVLGKMAHAERRGDSVAINIFGEQDMKIFESGLLTLNKISDDII